MGGFGALRNGLKYHDTFGAVICLSGALHVLENPEESRADSFAHEEGYFGNLVEAAKSDKNPAVLIEQLNEWDFWDEWIKKALDWLPLEEKTEGLNSGNVNV